VFEVGIGDCERRREARQGQPSPAKWRCT
jgi:hypothetical protein